MSIVFKTISFDPKLIPEILAGRKKSTIRYVPEMKNQIHAGDTVFLTDSSQKKPFALAQISGIEKKSFSRFAEEDFSSGQIPASFAEFKDMMQHFYPRITITEKTEWAIIRFLIFDDGQDRRLLDLLMQPAEDETQPDDENKTENAKT